MPQPTIESVKELPPIKDKIQQIFKFLEIADVSKWQGMNVFEAGDADSLYGILETAFAQVISEERKRCVEIVEKRKAEIFGETCELVCDDIIESINSKE